MFRAKLPSPRAEAGSDQVPEPAGRGLIAVITCSKDDQKFEALAGRYARLFGSERYELVRISDASSLCEGYNRAVAQSDGDLLIFTHDDVEILAPDAIARLRWYLDRWDLVGVAGTSRLVSANWLDAGPPYLFGQVAHSIPGKGFGVCIYGAPRPYAEDIMAMDGVFLAARREVVEQVPFDEKTFDRFHMYDADFTFSAYLAGHRLVVANDLGPLHTNTASYDSAYAHYAQRFMHKHHRHLASGKPREFGFARVMVQSRQEILEVTTPSVWEATGPAPPPSSVPEG